MSGVIYDEDVVGTFGLVVLGFHPMMLLKTLNFYNLLHLRGETCVGCSSLIHSTDLGRCDVQGQSPEVGLSFPSSSS